jgi:hypothetical protein
MDPTLLQDRISRGLGAAARAIGRLTDAYRPSAADDPLARTNRFLRLPAAFSAPDNRFARPNAFGAALWHGVFDAAYTRVGDYLVQGEDVWFVAAQQKLLPVLCVQANRTISLARPAAPAAPGANAYGGVTLSAATPLMGNWPASVLGAGGSGRPEADLPSDASVPYWTVLLPAWPGVTLRTGDLVTDDLARTAVVAAAELTPLGWRLSAKQATT